MCLRTGLDLAKATTVRISDTHERRFRPDRRPTRQPVVGQGPGVARACRPDSPCPGPLVLLSFVSLFGAVRKNKVIPAPTMSVNKAGLHRPTSYTISLSMTSRHDRIARSGLRLGLLPYTRYKHQRATRQVSATYKAFWSSDPAMDGP
jgi:hypothetical protein